MKNIKIQITLLIVGLGIATVNAQQAPVSSGGDALGSGGSASYSVGQVAYTFVPGTVASSNEGVQQPFEFYSVGIPDVDKFNLEIVAYPNPVSSVVNLLIKEQKYDDSYFFLYDLQGRLLLQQAVLEEKTTVPMQQFPSGTYLLEIQIDKKPAKSFTIIKNF